MHTHTLTHTHFFSYTYYFTHTNIISLYTYFFSHHTQTHFSLIHFSLIHIPFYSFTYYFTHTHIISLIHALYTHTLSHHLLYKSTTTKGCMSYTASYQIIWNYLNLEIRPMIYTSIVLYLWVEYWLLYKHFLFFVFFILIINVVFSRE